MDYELEVFYSEEDGEYVARAITCPSLSALGPTPERAIDEMEEVFKLLLESYEDDFLNALDDAREKYAS